MTFRVRQLDTLSYKHFSAKVKPEQSGSNFIFECDIFVFFVLHAKSGTAAISLKMVNQYIILMPF